MKANLSGEARNQKRCRFEADRTKGEATPNGRLSRVFSDS